MTYDPASPQPTPEPQPKKSNTTKIVLIVLVVVLLLILLCCGGFVALTMFGASQAGNQLAANPTVIENFGEAEVEMKIIPPQEVADRLAEYGFGYVVFEVDGADDDGFVIARQEGSQYIPVEIVKSDGTTITVEE